MSATPHDALYHPKDLGWTLEGEREGTDLEGEATRYEVWRHPEVPALRCDVDLHAETCKFAYDRWNDSGDPWDAGVFLSHNGDVPQDVLLGIARALDGEDPLDRPTAHATTEELLEQHRATLVVGEAEEGA